MIVVMVAPNSPWLFPNAAAVAVTLIPSIVLLTRPLGPDSGSQCTRPFAMQKTAASRVSCGDEIVSCYGFFIAGVVTSPNYPGEYPKYRESTETIQVETGKVLRLEFTRFEVEWDPTCQKDFVKITDGDGTTLMYNSCGFSSYSPSHSVYFLPKLRPTRSNRVEIFFHTDGFDTSTTSTGWSLSWSAVTPGQKALIQTAPESLIHLNCH